MCTDTDKNMLQRAHTQRPPHFTLLGVPREQVLGGHGAAPQDRGWRQGWTVSMERKVLISVLGWEQTIEKLTTIDLHNLQKAMKATLRGKCIAFITKRKDDNK